VQHLAKFDLIQTEFFVSQSSLLAIKQLNPSAVIIGYKDVIGMASGLDDWMEVNQQEDWFLHYTNGERIQTLDGHYAMNVGNPGWRQHYADYCNQKFLAGFDGVFADDVWNQFWKDLPNVRFKTPELIPDLPNWHQDMLGFITYVKSRIGSKLLIVNTPNNSDYVSAADGKVAEQFPFMKGTFVEINASSIISSSGKYYIAWGKGSQLSEMLYCLSGFLLGASGPKAYFCWNNIIDQSTGYYPELVSPSHR
jgi:hypothetical protein